MCPYICDLFVNSHERLARVRNGYFNRETSVEVAVPNTDNLLRPNQVAKLKIIDYSNKNALVVPSNVIQEDAKNNKYIYVVENATKTTGIAKKVTVSVGQSAENSTEITSGVRADDVIITEGANTVSDGMKLNF